MYCKKCGAQLPDDAQFCASCGTKVDGTVNMSEDLNRIAHPVDDGNASSRSRLVAALLAFFLGGFGVHEFYVGKTGAGILMLIFFWTGIVEIIAFVHFILILLGEFTDAEGKKLTLW
ncbi:MAG: NINE protein [Bacilli bacterium]|nr:NINE protein [Bacilli bacterium]